MKALVFVLVVSSLLSGCAAMAEAQERARENRRVELSRACLRYGFESGTPDHSRCMMQLDQNAVAARKREDQAQQDEYVRRQSELQKAMVTKPSTQTTCSSIPNGFGGFTTTCK